MRTRNWSFNSVYLISRFVAPPVVYTSHHRWWTILFYFIRRRKTLLVQSFDFDTLCFVDSLPTLTPFCMFSWSHPWMIEKYIFVNRSIHYTSHRCNNEVIDISILIYCPNFYFSIKFDQWHPRYLFMSLLTNLNNKTIVRMKLNATFPRCCTY